MMELTPDQIKMRDKLAHLTPKEREQALKLIQELAPAHNKEALKNKRSQPQPQSN